MVIKNAYEEVDIKMVKGDTLQFNMEFEDLTSDLSSAGFTIVNRTTGTAVVTKTLNSGITKVSSGVYTVRVAPTDTSSLDPDRYKYDLQIGVGSDIFTLMIGTLTLLKDATV